MRPLLDHSQGRSFLHQANPLAKLALNLALVVCLVLWTKPWPPAACTALLLASALATNAVPARRLAASVGPFVLLAGLWVVTTAVFYAGPRGHAIMGLAGLRDRVALEWGATRALRMLCVVTAALVFAATTDPSDLLRALVHQARVPYRAAFAALAGYRMLPLLAEEYRLIRAAHRVRGVPDANGVMGRLRRIRTLGIPLLAGAIRRAERMALALDARAFGAFPSRTSYRHVPFRTSDWALLVGGVGALATVTLVLQ
jgi:energy-coupling factor transport system permease protein